MPKEDPTGHMLPCPKCGTRINDWVINCVGPQLRTRWLGICFFWLKSCGSGMNHDTSWHHKHPWNTQLFLFQAGDAMHTCAGAKRQDALAYGSAERHSGGGPVRRSPTCSTLKRKHFLETPAFICFPSLWLKALQCQVEEATGVDKAAQRLLYRGTLWDIFDFVRVEKQFQSAPTRHFPKRHGCCPLQETFSLRRGLWSAWPMRSWWRWWWQTPLWSIRSCKATCQSNEHILELQKQHQFGQTDPLNGWSCDWAAQVLSSKRYSLSCSWQKQLGLLKV